MVPGLQKANSSKLENATQAKSLIMQVNQVGNTELFLDLWDMMEYSFSVPSGERWNFFHISLKDLIDFNQQAQCVQAIRELEPTTGRFELAGLYSSGHPVVSFKHTPMWQAKITTPYHLGAISTSERPVPREDVVKRVSDAMAAEDFDEIAADNHLVMDRVTELYEDSNTITLLIHIPRIRPMMHPMSPVPMLGPIYDPAFIKAMFFSWTGRVRSFPVMDCRSIMNMASSARLMLTAEQMEREALADVPMWRPIALVSAKKEVSLTEYKMLGALDDGRAGYFDFLNGYIRDNRRKHYGECGMFAAVIVQSPFTADEMEKQPPWVRSLANSCEDASIPFFVGDYQTGESNA